MKQLQLTKQQQRQFAQRINDELERVTMSWDKVLRDWYPIALRALEYASPISLNIPQNKFVTLFRQETHGINMNIVMALVNNIEMRSPHEMGVSALKWGEILTINDSIARRWNELAAPVQKAVFKEFEIMAGKPQLVIAEA